MKLTIEIRMDGAAFEGDMADAECARILRNLANCLPTMPGDDCILIDLNGNCCGFAKVTGR